MTTVILALGLVVGAWWFAGLRSLPTTTAPGAQVDVSVIVPARDEAATLPALLGSLHASHRAVHEVIVVDDASVDGTSAVALAHGGRVIRLDSGPPPGWTGKAYASARGAAAADGPMLLFLDADVTLAADGLDRLLAAHAEHGGLISVQPHHHIERPYETLSATCNVAAMLGTGAFAVWPRSRRPVAFGPCLLTTAADYAVVGGHSSVRGEVIEDLHLAARYVEHGVQVNAFAGGDALSFRMYPGGLRQLVDGWTKSLAAGAGLVSPLAVIACTWWVTACLAFGIRGIDAVVHAGSLSAAEAVIAALGWLAVTVELRWMLRRIGSFGWAPAVLHVVPMWAFVALFVRSLWLTVVRREVRWRGRAVAVGQRDSR